ncbi:MAG: SRPBCC family protein [Xanthomonadales bacterium]
MNDAIGPQIWSLAFLLRPAVPLPVRAGPLIKPLALLSLLLAPLLSQACEAPLPDLETMSRLRLGENVAESIRVDEKGGAVKVSLMIWAPVEDIWATVYSCENAFIFLAGLEVCEVLEDDGVDTVTRQVLNKGWPVPRQDYKFRTHRVPYTRADIHLVEGKLKFMQASWEYISMPEAVVVIYKVRLQPGFPAPRFLVRRALKKGMTGLLACVRALAGGSGSAEQEKEDLGYCPGDIGQAAR